MTVNDGSMAATLSKIRSECEICGTWSSFTGRTELHDGQTYAILRCPNGDGVFPVWNHDREPLIAAYERARANLHDPAAYQRAWDTLTGGDGEAIAALVAAGPPELPLFSIEDVALPAAAAPGWCEMLLDGAGWRPAPTRTVRVEEAMATALQHESQACVDTIAARVAPDDASRALERLASRFPHRDLSLLAPLLPGSRQTGKSTTEAHLLRSMAERLCAVATGTEEEIRAALAIPTPAAPLGARELEVTGGVLSRAGVEFRFSPPVFTRAQLEDLFGQGQALPRTGPGAAHVLAYEVRTAGAPARVSVFARFSGPPKLESGPTSILLRIDPAGAGDPGR